MTRDMQLLYINNRLVRNLEFVSTIIDNIYVIVVKNEGTRGGMTQMHFDPKSSKVSMHPSFVLQIKCPCTEFDLYSAPDKSKITFKYPTKIKELVESRNFQTARTLLVAMSGKDMLEKIVRRICASSNALHSLLSSCEEEHAERTPRIYCRKSDSAISR